MSASTSSTVIGRRALLGLMSREFKRFVRQPSRIIAAVGTPLLFWGFMASGFASSVFPGAEESDGSYTAYLIPGAATLVAMFASIFAAMSLIEDRREGFLRAALASPAPRWAIVGAKAGAGSAVATLQASIVLLAAPLVGAQFIWPGLLLALVWLSVAAAALTSLGLALAWVVNSSEGFHGVMNAVLMPMWLLSGAMFPIDGAASWLRPVMLVNPLFWATETVRDALSGSPPGWTALGSVGFLVAAVTFATAVMARSTRS